jgi:VCBS repeat protein/HYR domain-containing protein/thrombospondin type 3 repeat protein
MRPSRRSLALIALLAGLASTVPGGATPSSLPTVVTGGPVLTRPFVSVGENAHRIVVADLDGDPHPDLVVSNLGQHDYRTGTYFGGTLSLVRGRGDGTMEPAVTLYIGSVNAVAVADLNGDGYKDLLTSNLKASNVQARLWTGAGTYGAAITTTLPGVVSGIATGDFNHDGRPDLAASLGLIDQVVVLLGAGDGHFATSAILPGGNTPEEMAVGDLDEDGQVDLVVAGRGVTCLPEDPCTGEPGDLTFLRGIGDGTFAAPVDVMHGPRFDFLALGDFTGDGHLDVAVSVSGPETQGGILIVPWRGADGPGTPLPPIVAGGPWTAAMSVVDANGDRFADLTLLTVNPTNYGPDQYVATLLMHDEGAFDEVLLPLSPSDVTAMTSADLTGDGRPEVALTHAFSLPNALEVLSGAGSGNLVTEECTASGGNFGDVAIADLDADGRGDLIAYDTAPQGINPTDPGPLIRTFLATGDGKFREGASIPVPGPPFNYDRVALLETDDFDTNGIPDVAVLNPDSGQVTILLGRGGGAFTRGPILQPPGGAFALAAGRFDADERTDLAVLQPCGNVYCNQGRVALYRGDGSGGFAPPVFSGIGLSYPQAILAGDFDGNGRDELVISSSYTATHHNVGDDLKVDAGTEIPGGASYGSAAVDVDRDGDLDLVTGSYLFIGRGDGSFESGRDLHLASQRATTADLNGDGWPDLIGWPYGAEIHVVLSDAHGGFGPVQTHHPGLAPGGLANLDADGDGRIDTVFTKIAPYPSQVCIARNVSGNPDADADGIPDAGDTCIDTDGDGLADRLTDISVCPLDNCPSAPNADQSDSDGDSLGDACDACPFDASNDPDRDGACEGRDTCPGTYNPGQQDQDGDGFGDLCDNCPSVASANQSDWDGDGAGDACQPRLAFTGIVEDGGEALEVLAAASDPQADPLVATVSITGPPAGFTVPNILLHENDVCNPAYGLPVSGGPGRGVIYAAFADQKVLYDLDAVAYCSDGQQDYVLMSGSCDAPEISFGDYTSELNLTGVPLPTTICIARFPSIDGFVTLTVLAADNQEILLSYSSEDTLLDATIPGGFPPDLPLPELRPDVDYKLHLSVSDGQTLPARAARSFRYHGESTLVFDADADDDGITDDLDPCVDPDADGRGSPGAPATTCPLDNCPAAANADQADADGDGVGDACDPCTDPDHDGFGSPGYPATTCAIDNCPDVANAFQDDVDHDGIGDACDPCIDTDGDGYGVAGPATTCPQDNCPNVANPGQEDADADNEGDACDFCTDPDHDGFGSPGFPASVCPLDNCPTVPNAIQTDTDGDGFGDACDTCTDPDRDGFGNPGPPDLTCPLDNCPAAFNPGQEDVDGDGMGDVCDPCPVDPFNDGDHDGLCANDDNCPLLANAAQDDADLDGVGDLCDTCTDVDHDGWGSPGFPASICPVDNCPRAANPGQEDSDGDAVGDACDPCPSDPTPDTDHDGFCGAGDNCPFEHNPLQRDRDGDGVGDACDDLVPGARFPFPVYEVGRIPDVMLTHDFNGDGLPDVAVASRANATVTVLLSLGDGRLRPGSPVHVSSLPDNLAAGDVNGDGYADLVAGSYYGLVSIMLGDGQGGLQEASWFTVPYGGGSVGLGRFDGDANLDLVVTDYYSRQLRVYAGDGRAGFALRSTLPLVDPPGRLLIADVNGDGFDDVVVPTSNRVRIFAGRADGSFAETAVEIGTTPYFFLARDLDDDGRLDLIGVGSGVTVLLQTHPLDFDALPAFTVPYSYDTWGVADDLDGDGQVDLLVGNMGLWHGNGDGTFTAPAAPLFLSRVSAAAAADLDGDERTDLVLALGETQVTTARNAGGGAFVLPNLVANLNVLPANAVLADLDEDGVNDLIWNRLDLIWARGQGGGTFAPPVAIHLYDSALGFVVADLDQDGHLDIAAATTRDTVIVLLGRGDGTFANSGTFVVGRGSRAVAAGDLNHDGRVDLVIGNGGVYYDPQSSSISVLIGNGDGTFAAERRYATSASPRQLALGDFNEDGHVDVAVTNYDSGIVSLFAGVGDGTLTSLPSVPTGPRPQGMTAADLDGDGHLDLAVAILGPDQNIPGPRGELVLLQGLGDGRFASSVHRVYGDRPTDVVSADFDFDGRPDLAVAFDTNSTATYGQLVLLLNKGSLDFSAERFAAGNPSSLANGDVDGDPRPDLVLLNAFESVVVYRNAGPFPPDSDGDGISDVTDPCTDTDNDGFGNPGFPHNTCPLDNCPALPNPDQADADGDGLGDACDACAADPGNDADGDGICGDRDVCPHVADPKQVDSDGDGAGDACDNCPGLSNPGQADHDQDGIGDACDPCTDSDHDGLGDPGMPLNTCPPDNCPYVAGPSQADADGDGMGDICDPCTDRDGDGFGDPGFPANTCARDNCPDVANTGQADADADGIGDVCDPCAADPMNDVDRDGVCGDLDVCPAVPDPAQTDTDGDRRGDACDNCPGTANAGQADTDHDGVGDACDPCTDIDHDGAGDPGLPFDICPRDNCPGLPNPSQEDADHDGTGDICDTCTDRDGDGFGDSGFVRNTCASDNCPATPNPGQEDANRDGSGDACQPSIVIEGVTPDGAGSLRAVGMARDPQGESLSGVVRVNTSSGQRVILQDALMTYECSRGLQLGQTAGEGIAYTFGALGEPLIFDLDGWLGCSDSSTDFLLAPGTCTAPTQPFDFFISLAGLQPPFPICVRGMYQGSGGTDMFVEHYDEASLTLVQGSSGTVVAVPFAAGIPDSIVLSALVADRTYSLEIEVTDGNTRPITASSSFIWHGEPLLRLVFNDAPAAAITAPATVECTSPSGGLVHLDGSSSSDPDSTPGSRDAIVRYEWYEGLGTSAETLLGTGESLTVTLGLGVHALTLKVTDSEGASASAEAVVTIADTTPPVLECPGAAPAAECTGAGGAAIEVAATAHDACGGAPLVTNNRTSAGADASGAYPLGTTLVGFEATDASGNHTACSVPVTVVDTVPPDISVVADPPSLWPPNHGMVPVHLVWQTSDRCDPAGVRVEVASSASSEPDDDTGPGDGETSGDIEGADLGTADADILLRAERDGRGPGRIYELRYRAIDRAGNGAPGLAVVTVPHDLGDGPEPLLLWVDSATAGSTGVRVAWPTVAGALAYDVIRGDLGALHRDGEVTTLGAVTVLARGTMLTSTTEPGGASNPEVGHGFFYLAQQWTDHGPVGYGTESAPRPRVPESCDGGCPGAPNGPAGGSTRPRR